MALTEQQKHPGGVLKRAVRNAGMLLTGKVAAALMQLGTFALAARGLGVENFGFFAMLLAQVQLLTGIASFQSNQAIVRYGVGHLEAGNISGLQTLITAGVVLDTGAATLAAIATLIVSPIAGHMLGWSDAQVQQGQLLALLAFTNMLATPRGILRLVGRFDLLTRHAVVTPFLRLVGIAVAFLLDLPMTVYLLIWIVAGYAGVLVIWRFAWLELRQRGVTAAYRPHLKGLLGHNPGVWRFTLFSNLHSSVALLPSQASTWLVGALMGPTSAGLFKVAREIGTALGRPVDFVNQALFPDLARLSKGGEWRRLRQTILRAGAIAGLVSATITVTVFFAGDIFITTIFGKEYHAASGLLVLLSLATTFGVIAFAADPALYALGRPDISLGISVVANLIFVGLLVWLVRLHGLSGAGIAYIAMSGFMLISSLTAALVMIGRHART